MHVVSVELEGGGVRLEPMAIHHVEALFEAASDGALWESDVTVVPASIEAMAAYVSSALEARSLGRELPFVVWREATNRIVGTTRYRAIDPLHRRVEIGSTWLSRSAQRSEVNTAAKFLLLEHAFEQFGALRVEFMTDVLNEASRRAILRIGAKEEGILRHHKLMPDGRHRNSVCYSVVRPEWPDVRQRLIVYMEAAGRAGKKVDADGSPRPERSAS